MNKTEWKLEREHKQQTNKQTEKQNKQIEKQNKQTKQTNKKQQNKHNNGNVNTQARTCQLHRQIEMLAHKRVTRKKKKKKRKDFNLPAFQHREENSCRALPPTRQTHFH